MIQIKHSAIKGRARFRVSELYRSEALKCYIELRLSEKSDVTRASANPMTGNVLVFFNSDNTPDTIALLIEHIVADYREPDSPFRPASELQSADTVDPWGCNPPDSRKSESPSSFRKRLGSLLPKSIKPQPAASWHTMPAEAVLDSFGASAALGLTCDSAKEQLERYGPNVLPESAPRSQWSMFIDQFKSLPVALLSVAAGISVFTGGMADAVVILGVVVINAAIGYKTESEAERTIESLKNLVRPSAHVVRGGLVAEIPLEEVVPGDLLALRPGSYIPADSRLVDAHHLSVDESTLTGESLPVHKAVEPLKNENMPLADRLNMVFMGTLVTGGQGLAVVIATGKFTEVGRLQALVGEATAPDTPMETQLARMGNQLVFISGAVCALVFLIGLLRGNGFLQMLKMSISLAVAAVPEGLPAVATTTLALGIRNMNGQNVLIRHLDAVETLGAVQTICFDKTGTVTENRMSVRRLYVGARCVDVADGRFFSEQGMENPAASTELLQLINVCILCNETEIIEGGNGYTLEGSSTEKALIWMAIDAGVDLTGLRKRYPLLKTNHRSEDRHFMGTLHQSGKNDRLIALKGSPLDVLAMCDYYLEGGERVSLTDQDLRSIELENERMAADALRVLGFAYSIEQDDESFDLCKGLTWLGLVGMADPIRNGVKELIGQFHQAGIDTVMITGDQSPTAYAIGKELDLSRGRPIEILDSMHLTNIDSDALRALSERVHVFARVSPAHKLQIVQALQQAGRVVAMTGDGINDGPALKAADIGVAMGSSGTDIAREVADVVLENDNLETMIAAVSHGRTIYNNIRKSVHFLLATNFSEIMVMFFASTAGLGYPLTAMQLLWINLISDIFPGLALALEPPEPDVLKRPPRDPREPITKTSDLKRITFEAGVMSASALAAYGYGIARYGMGARANSIAFQSLTLAQLLHAISCRSEKHSVFDRSVLPSNRYLNMALGGSLGIQILTMVVPGLRRLLGVSPVNLIDGILIGASALFPLVINEATKNTWGGGKR